MPDPRGLRMRTNAPQFTVEEIEQDAIRKSLFSKQARNVE